MKQIIDVSCDSSRVLCWTSFLEGFPRKEDKKVWALNFRHCFLGNLYLIRSLAGLKSNGLFFCLPFGFAIFAFILFFELVRQK